MLKSCQHQNIVKFYGAYTHQEEVWVCENEKH